MLASPRSLVTSLFLFLAFSCVQAQKPEWIRNSVMEPGSYGRTYGKRMAVHPDGHVFVMGQYWGKNLLSGQPLQSVPDITLTDCFLAKYDSDGDLIWIKQLFSSQQWYANQVIDLKVDQAGDLVFSGSCLWPSSILGSAVGTGPFIAKINKDGNLLWLNFQPTPGTVAEHDVGRNGNRIGFDADNNILWLTDQINEFGPSGALVVMKYKSDGTKLAAMPVVNATSFYRPGIQDFSVDRFGNFVVSGNYSTSVSINGGPFLNNYQGSNFNPIQLFVAKFSPTGNFMWVVSSQYDGNLVSCHTTDLDGSVYVGLQMGNGQLVTPHGVVTLSSQRSLAKFSSDGRLEWINPVTFTNLEDIILAPDGLLYVTGIAFGNELKYQTYVRPTHGDAAFILKVSQSGSFYGLYMGEPQDNTATPEGPSVYGFQSIVDMTGNIYTMGNFYEGQVWGCIPAATDGDSFFLVKHIPMASPVRTITGPPPVCEETQITLSTNLISNGVLYKWFKPDGSAPGPGATLNNSTTMIAKKVYDQQPVIVSIQDNCDTYFAEPFILDILAEPTKPALVESKATVCPATLESFKITVEDDVDYQWTFPTGITAPGLTEEGGDFAFASNFVEGQVKVTATNICGSKELSFKIDTYKTPGAPVLTGNENICYTIVQLQKSITAVADALSYEWDLPDFITFNPLYPRDATTLRALVDPNFKEGEIKVRAVGQCKPGPASLPIVIKRFPNADDAKPISGPEEVCIGETNLRYYIPAIDHAVEYTWTIPPIFNKTGPIVTTVPFIDLKAVSGGTGKLSVYGISNCRSHGDSAIFNVVTHEPIAEPRISIDACDQEITVKDAVDFSWYYNGVSAPHLSGNILTLRDSGNYYVEATGFCGAKQSNVIQAYPVITSNLLIPNVITPNGDGKNDFLVIDRSLANSHVLVTNRWGTTVYSSPNYQNNWDASGLASGTYFLTVQNPCLGKSYKSWLSVLK